MAYLTNSYDVSDDATKRFTTSTTNTASNSSIATMSFWLKRRSALYRQEAMNSSVGSTNDGYLNIRSDDSGVKLFCGGYSINTFVPISATTEDALDEWVHYVMHWDTTTADGYSTRIYRNGVFLEGTYGNPGVNTKCALTRGDGSAVNVLGGLYNFDGWMADLHIVDGLTVPVTDFADEQDGVWSAKEYSGSHGNNGAWFDGSLDVKDSVKVWSSNSLDASNLSTDIPPLYSVAPPIWASDLLVVSRGGVEYKITRGELDAYLNPGILAKLNPDVSVGLSSTFYIDNDDLDLVVTTNASYRNVSATILPEGLKCYFEQTFTGTPNFYVGFMNTNRTAPNASDYSVPFDPTGAVQINASGAIRNGNSTIKSGYTSAFTNSDTLSYAFDFTDGKRNVWWAHNGVWGTTADGLGIPETGTNPAFTIATINNEARMWFAQNTGAGDLTSAFNFGQSEFKYTLPSGFKSFRG